MVRCLAAPILTLATLQRDQITQPPPGEWTSQGNESKSFTSNRNHRVRMVDKKGRQAIIYDCDNASQKHAGPFFYDQRG